MPLGGYRDAKAATEAHIMCRDLLFDVYNYA